MLGGQKSRCDMQVARSDYTEPGLRNQAIIQGSGTPGIATIPAMRNNS
jgi:hypothetical protein